MPVVERNVSLLVPQEDEWNLLALTANSMDVIHKIRKSSRTLVQEAVPKVTPKPAPICLTEEEENKVLILLDINQLAFLQGQLSEGIHLKNALLKYIL